MITSNIMSLIIVLFLFFALIMNIRYVKYNSDYIDRSTTMQINGVFVFIILLKHLKEYIVIADSSELIFLGINDFLLQLVVVTFFFYSGYGVMQSISKKGNDYIKNIPSKCLDLLLRFDIIVLFYLIIQSILGNYYTFDRILQSLIGWSAIGNSNWYFFVIVLMYLLTYFSFRCFKDSKNKAILLNLILSFILIFILIGLKGEQRRWYDTFICYNFGMFYSYYKVYIEKFLKQINCLYGISLFICFVMFFIFKSLRTNLICYHIHGLLFCCLIVLLSMKLAINSRILIFLGSHVFSIYMLQRLVMIVLKSFGVQNNVIIFVVMSILFTLILAVIFDYLYHNLSRKFRKVY